MMTERSGLVDKEQISKLFGRSFIELIENFVDKNDQLEVIYGLVFNSLVCLTLTHNYYRCLTALFNGMGQEGRGLVLKKILMHFLRKFPTDFDNTEDANDYICKTLHLWQIFGKCSKTGPILILEKIEDSYADCWQYYKMFAESIIEEGTSDGEKLYNVFKKCMENCDLTIEEVSKKFGQKVMLHIKFPAPADEDECTVQFMQIVNQQDRRKSMAARRRSTLPTRLDIVLEKTDENAASTDVARLSLKENGRQPMVDIKSSAQKQKILQPAAPSYHTPSFQQHQKTDESPASFFSTYFSGRQDHHKTTLATARSPEVTVQTTTKSPPKDDFSVLRDPSVTLKTARQAHQFVPSSPSTQSPCAKRNRSNPESTNIYVGKENHRSFDQDSPTICGTHLKRPNNGNSSFLTSTPEAANRQAAKLFANVIDQSTLNFNNEQTPPSLDAIDKEVQKIINGRRKTIGPNNESPEYSSRPKTAASAPPTQQKPKHKTSMEKMNSLTRNLNQFHLPSNNSSNSSHDVTGTGNVSLVFEGVLNPWNEADRDVILSTSKFIPQRNNYPDQQCPSIDKNHPFKLGDKNFQPLKQIGEGGFARVFKCKTEEGQVVALKYQKPKCAFESHVVDMLQHVLPKNLKPFVMSIMDAYIYKDASFLIYEYLPYKTLLELSNAYRIQGNDIYGGVITFVGYQLGHVLQRIHEAKIVHADLKPDNILICAPLPEDKPIAQLLDFPFIRLIDFGRAIDMNYFRAKNFTGKAKTQCFECEEMKAGRPWTYQTDFYGYVATVYTLIHHQYLETKTDAGRVKPKLPIKRRMVTGSIWTGIFDKFLNIPSCSKIPQWSPTLAQVKEELLSLQQTDVPGWKNAVVKLNKMVQSNYEKP
ncbi:Protein kinase domain-containing protein [Aphelenchoides bicaudatus]|nr:Protein kinase domain-containing protein [Aphelenchoides bicaudatus]